MIRVCPGGLDRGVFGSSRSTDHWHVSALSWGAFEPRISCAIICILSQRPSTCVCSERTQDKLMKNSGSTANPQAAGSGHRGLLFQDDQENSRSLCVPFHSSDFPFGEARLNSVSTSLMIQAFRAQ